MAKVIILSELELVLKVEFLLLVWWWTLGKHKIEDVCSVGCLEKIEN